MHALPITLEFEDRAALRAVTETFDRESLTFYLAEDADVPEVGLEATFDVRIASTRVTGKARVVAITHVDDADRHEMVITMAIIDLPATAATALARVDFREKVEEYALNHADGERILAASGDGARIKPTRANTAPLVPLEARWVEGSAVPKSERTGAPAAHHGMHESGSGEIGRVRPKPTRHHWENAARFKIR
jgi:hypothetical protein